ncbi:hypothetical protein A11A3_02727 [Alcanivorax hongdengensis A-11-3]|uniref:Porin domain-containing protein n=1 Tax=Alcanivorax hongdengensis A-11-3 TaxID=1177179 RepID=L0WFW8_9GAMM|nr:hypothetical protein [Alcanivorax hongdengensis]EKF75748.1 hypothetical protein A11A3_02727 [Alcanivorax hongdengensis A-11-3]
MDKALAACLGAALTAVTVSAQAQPSDSSLEQQLQDYEARLEALESQAASAYQTGPQRLQVNGFLSTGVLHTDADVAGGSVHYADGADDQWRFDKLTRAGLRIDATLNERTHAVMQLYASGEDDFQTELQWGYLDYQLTDAISLKAGRMVAPFYMHSQYVDVGYAYPWVTPPSEVYRTVPIKAMEALEASWNFNTGPVAQRLSAFWGTGRVEGGVRSADTVYQADDLAGINLTSQWQDWSLRVAYNAASVSVDPLPDSIKQLNSNFGTGLSFDDVYTWFAGLGLQYDDGDWYLAAERARLDFNNWYPGRDSGYVTMGHYFGKWMPVLTWSMLKYYDINDAYLPQLQGSPVSPTVLQDSLAERQKGWTAGLRYSVNESLALKGEVSYYYDFSDADYDTSGFFVTEGGNLDDDHATVIRLSADLVF